MVAAQHRVWWRTSLGCLPASNVIVQPANRGTAIGILFPVLQIKERDPDATIVILPSDHHVENEAILMNALQQAVGALGRHRDHVLLLGIEPEDADPDLGYVIPAAITPDGTAAVLQFVEKPPIGSAEKLIEEGALWNAFIIVARAAALLTLFENNAPDLVSRTAHALRGASSAAAKAGSIEDLYRTMLPLDFSRHIVRGQESHLRVMQVPSCGWNDLGTPKRVAATLRRAAGDLATCLADREDRGALNLAAQPFWRQPHSMDTLP